MDSLETSIASITSHLSREHADHQRSGGVPYSQTKPYYNILHNITTKETSKVHKSKETT